MKDENKTKAQLIKELNELRQRVGTVGMVEAEKAVEKTTTDYTMAFDAIPLPATLIDANGIVVDVNSAFLNFAYSHGREIRREDRIGGHIASFAATVETRT